MIGDTAPFGLPFHLVVAGCHRDDVHAGRRDLILDGRTRAVADRHHREHRADANRDAEQRQRRPKSVAAERAPRERETGGELHGVRP
ncbi:MAG: hypothetical protein QM736_10960 [Vicinamibacterales bacterium]